jgi:hypothetical protein
MKLKKLNKGFWSFTLKALVVTGIITYLGIFMIKNKEIAIALMPWATLLLAFAAFWTIWQNYSLHKKERKERLLNEIIEWAVDVAKCEFTVNIQEPLPIFSKLYEKSFREYEFQDKQELIKGIMLDSKRFWLNHYMNLHRNYQVLGTKGEYIINLSSAKYFESIINSVRKVKAQISGYQDGLWEYMRDIDDKSKKEKLENEAKELHTRAVELIKEATKIKTRDIG